VRPVFDSGSFGDAALSRATEAKSLSIARQPQTAAVAGARVVAIGADVYQDVASGIVAWLGWHAAGPAKRGAMSDQRIICLTVEMLCLFPGRKIRL
jgi:hypothetical protein